MEASVSDLRKNMGKVMSAIERRERVTLTYRGRRKAVIVPILESKSKKVKVADLAAFGMRTANVNNADVDAYVRKMREARKV